MERIDENQPEIDRADAMRIQFHDEVPHGARIKVIGVGGGGMVGLPCLR